MFFCLINSQANSKRFANYHLHFKSILHFSIFHISCQFICDPYGVVRSFHFTGYQYVTLPGSGVPIIVRVTNMRPFQGRAFISFYGLPICDPSRVGRSYHCTGYQYVTLPGSGVPIIVRVTNM